MPRRSASCRARWRASTTDRAVTRYTTTPTRKDVPGRPEDVRLSGRGPRASTTATACSTATTARASQRGGGHRPDRQPRDEHHAITVEDLGDRQRREARQAYEDGRAVSIPATSWMQSHRAGLKGQTAAGAGCW